jgi:hypothetical protein
MSIPKIVERKIVVLEKPGGTKQYVITLPREYGASLEADGVRSLFIVFNRGLGAFPKIEGFTEEALMTFLSKHSELTRLFSEIEAKQAIVQKVSTKEAPE